MNFFKRLIVVVPITFMLITGTLLSINAWLFIGPDAHRLTFPFEVTSRKLMDWAERNNAK